MRCMQLGNISGYFAGIGNHQFFEAGDLSDLAYEADRLFNINMEFFCLLLLGFLHLVDHLNGCIINLQ